MNDHSTTQSLGQSLNSDNSAGGAPDRPDVRRTGPGGTTPPNHNMGVEFGIHWITLTVWLENDEALRLYETNFKDIIGEIQEQGYGGIGYNACKVGLGGFKMYYSNPGLGRVTFVVPGTACSAIPPELWKLLYRELDWNMVEFQFSRIDTAFDGVPFTPDQVYEAVMAGEVRSLTHRATLRKVHSPLEIREDGSAVGCTTTYFGSRTSEKYLRVYDQHGFTRLEAEYKGDRANLVARAIFDAPIEDWATVAIAHLRDFLDIHSDWWDDFTRKVKRAFAKIADIKQYSLDCWYSWIEKQVAPALSVLVDAIGSNVLDVLVDGGRSRRNQIQQSLVRSFQAV